jgi:hypothetical protein
MLPTPGRPAVIHTAGNGTGGLGKETMWSACLPAGMSEVVHPPPVHAGYGCGGGL